jgi:hypothetical protein
MPEENNTLHLPVRKKVTYERLTVHKVFIIASISVILFYLIAVKYIHQCNYHVDINSYYKFVIRFGIRRKLFVNILLHNTIYTGKIWIIKIIQNKSINRDVVWIRSLSYVSLTQNVVNMELTFLAVDSALLKTLSNLVYFHIFIHICAWTDVHNFYYQLYTQFSYSESGFRTVWSSPFCLILV